VKLVEVRRLHAGHGSRDGRDRLAAAGVEVTQVREPAPGLRVFDARDPDGNRFAVESRRPT
jgi:predicted enzyme related to lactoylglutathione lyase